MMERDRYKIVNSLIIRGIEETFTYFLTEKYAVFATAVVFEAVDEVLDLAAFAEEELG